MSHPYANEIARALRPLRDPETATGMKRYMRNRFDFLGVKMPVRRTATRPLFRPDRRPDIADLPEITEDLFGRKQREFQYAAVDLLDVYRGELPASFLGLAESLITTKSWWDTVDGLASHLVGDLAARHAAAGRRAINRWRKAGSFWLRRATLIHQLGYKARTDAGLLFEIIRENRPDPEFFIQKAIGWSLRECSKTDADAVVRFVEEEELEGLARREALKWLKAQGQL